MKKIGICFLFLILVACQKDLPEPEVKVSVVPMSIIQSAHDLPVTTASSNNEKFLVQHHVKDNTVFVECMLPDISFRDYSENQGKIILYVDGKKKDVINTAAFIIKGLSTGTHEIRLEVIKENDEPYFLHKEFTVNIS